MQHTSNLVCGNYCTVCISDQCEVYTFGLNTDGKLGFEIKDNKQIYPPKQIPSLTNIKMVRCGFSSTICINFDGDVFTFGCNTDGQLGKPRKELKNTHIPQKLDLPPIQYIASGSYFCMCLSYDRVLYSFGANNKGQLGIGNTNTLDGINIITALPEIDIIDCGSGYTYCVTTEGIYYSWGSNYYGMLSHGNISSQYSPKLCCDIPPDIVSFRCSDNHVLFLTNSGDVYACGGNSSGQIGQPKSVAKSPIPLIVNGLPEIQRIECGNSHSLCIDIDDYLWVFGSNSCAELGLGDKISRPEPEKHEKLGKILDVSNGGPRTFMKTFDNEIYACGGNTEGQLGIKPCTEYITTPTRSLKEYEYIWNSNVGRSKQKSARN